MTNLVFRHAVPAILALIVFAILLGAAESVILFVDHQTFIGACSRNNISAKNP